MSRPPLSNAGFRCLYEMFEVLKRECELNAAAGFVLSPGLPAPEVFERPGWDVIQAPPGAGVLELTHLDRSLPLTRVDASAEARPVQIVREEVHPVVGMETAMPGVPRYLGLGFSTRARRYVLFSSEAEPLVWRDDR